MKKTSLIFFSLIISIVITYLTTNITFYSPGVGENTESPNYYKQVHGFPFALDREFSTNVIILQSVLIKYFLNPYFFTFLFWFSGSLMFLLLLQYPKWKRLLFFVGIIAFFLMNIFLQNGRCLEGYPIPFLPHCIDVTSPNNPLWFFAMLNYSFWLVISLEITLIFFYAATSTIRLIKLFIPPLILTLFFIVNQSSCGNFCIFPTGRGLPLPFLSDDFLVTNNSLYFFSINYIFWWIAYNSAILIKHQILDDKTKYIPHKSH